MIETLEKLPDAELQEVLKKGQAILKARELERRRGAVREIQKLAREHGLSVDVGDRHRKRDRPPKAKEGAG